MLHWMNSWPLKVTLIVFLMEQPWITAAQESKQPVVNDSAVTVPISPQLPQNDIQASGPKQNLGYTIHASDTLELLFRLTPEFDQVVTVQPDGVVSLRGIGELHVAGETIPEVTASLKTAYSAILKDPMISVSPRDYEKPSFIVTGQVNKPGKFDWRGDVTLTQALAIAGGFNDVAKHSQVVLYRRVSNEWAPGRLIDVKHMLNARDLREDPLIEPGDMIYVPKNSISKVKPFLPIPTIGSYVPLNY